MYGEMRERERMNEMNYGERESVYLGNSSINFEAVPMSFFVLVVKFK